MRVITDPLQDFSWAQVRPLIEAVRKLSLSSFTWSATPGIPRQLAQALAKSENCRVNIEKSDMAIEYSRLALAPYLNKWHSGSLHLMAKNLTKLHVTRYVQVTAAPHSRQWHRLTDSYVSDFYRGSSPLLGRA